MANTVKYQSLSLTDLIKKIAIQRDQSSLEFFLTFRKVVVYQGDRLTLPEYFRMLWDTNFCVYIKPPTGELKLADKLDLLYNRLVGKFCILRSGTEESGPYCEKQYDVIYSRIQDIKSDGLTAVEIELEVERIIKSTVVHHIYLTWIEVCRDLNPSYKRYRWNAECGSIELKRPVWLSGNEFRTWLEENFPNPEPKERDLRDRIQTAVYQQFGHISELLIDADPEMEIADISTANPNDGNGWAIKRLYRIVANEKADNVAKLRPAIQRLGKDRVHRLVLTIFDRLDSDNSDTTIAEEFGLTKASYSRFAGRSWIDNPRSDQVPDLWKNTAKIVFQDPLLIDAAAGFGINRALDLISRS